MRLQFAEKHNLIVIQCDYFGNEYMQTSNKIKFSMAPNEFKNLFSVQDYNLIKNERNSFHKIIKVLSKYTCVLNVSEDLKEKVTSFNDMGFMQALDLLSALYAVKLILKDNSLTYNESKVILYGHSHGAYLAYLCNRLAPNDFSLIIDNSAWLKPVYLTSSRYLNQRFGKMVIQTRFDYFAREFVYDKEILNLSKFYDGFENKAFIWSFQGETDNLVNHKEKEMFCNNLENTTFNLIDENKVDNEKFYSTGHGLQADFIKHFDYVMENVEFKSFNRFNKVYNETITFKNKKLTYKIDFKQGLPVMTICD